MAAFNENRYEEGQAVGIAQVDSILDQIEHNTLDDHLIDAFLLAQANEERDNPPIQLEEEREPELTEEQQRQRDIENDQYLGGWNRYLGHCNYGIAQKQRKKDLQLWKNWMDKGLFKQVIHATNIEVAFDDWPDSFNTKKNSHWRRPFLQHRYDPDLECMQGFRKLAIENRQAEKAHIKAQKDEQLKQLNAFSDYVFNNTPYDQPIPIKFVFMGREKMVMREKIVHVDKNIFIREWFRVPTIRDLFISMVYYHIEACKELKETDANSYKEYMETLKEMGFSLFPIQLNIDPELPVIPKAIDAYVHYINNVGEFHEDTHLLTATVAEALGDFEFGEKMIMATDPMLYTVDSIGNMTPTIEESFIRSYLDACFNVSLSGMNWKVRRYHARRERVAKKYGFDYFPIEETNIDKTTGGFRKRMRVFIEKKPDIARYTFENHRKVMETYYRVPNRQSGRYKKVVTFDDLIAFLNDSDSIAESKSAGASEVVILARKDPHISRLYAKFDELVNRNRRNDWMDEEAEKGGLNPQEREDALREQIALAEKRFIAKYNQTRVQTGPKNHIAAAKAACSSKRGKR